MYNVGTVTTTANSTKLIGTGTKWKDNNSRVSAEQVILIQNGATIYINSIASIQSNTEITLSFPVPASVSNAPYQILTTMVNSVSDAANKVVAMNVANVQFSDILNRWATESGTITVTLPDGTTQQLRTAKEMDKLLDGKFDKTGGVVEGGVTAIALGSTRKQTNSTIYLYPAPESSPDGYAYFQYRIGDNWFGRAEIPRPASNQTTRLMQVGDYGLGENQPVLKEKISSLPNGFWRGNEGIGGEIPGYWYGVLMGWGTANTSEKRIFIRLLAITTSITGKQRKVIVVTIYNFLWCLSCTLKQTQPKTPTAT